ncbi:MAG TPA: hypothetical protein VMU64_08525 [Acidimicrobiales bacterium]|nr:hypothetical protein [Acidimicrobiales bacterium]
MPDNSMPDNSMPGASVAGDIEARLRHAMAVKAQSEPVAPADWGVFAARLASTTRKRQRVLVGAAGLALLIGAAGGYFGEVAASPVAARISGPGPAPSTTAPSGGNRSISPSASGPAVMCPNNAGGAPGTSSGTTSTNGSGGNGSGDIGSATHVLTRTTSDGVKIRVYQDASNGVSCIRLPTPVAGSASTGTVPVTTTAPAPSGSVSSPVFETGPGVTVELSDDDAVGQGAITETQCVMTPDGGVGAGASPPGVITNPVPTAPVTTVPVTTIPTTTTPITPGQPHALSTGVFGVTEGDPVWWVGVEVGNEVSSVRVTFPDGATDEMAPVNGVAVLAHKVASGVASAESGPYEVRGTLELLGAGGNVLDTVTLPEQSAPVPVPTPMSIPANAGSEATPPNLIEVCPPLTIEPQAQSSATTENR